MLIVNDDLEAALEADGLHAGQEDLIALDGRALRARLGRRVLGVSCGIASEAQAAETLGADYVGTGPVAATVTKGDAGAPIGAGGLRAVVSATRLPVVAIGGLTLAGLAEVAAAGAAMAAVVSAIARAPDPGAAARAFVERWSELSG
jgi:thiamine-phosphate pyrophosphorylase